MIQRTGNFGMMNLGRHGMATFEISASTKLASNGVFPLFNNRVWESQPLQAGEFKVVPHGDTNQLPIELRDIMDDNNLAEGIFKRQRGLLWGQGPCLYEQKIENGEVKRNWVADKQIQDWLNSWNYEEYLTKQIVDFTHVEGDYTKFVLSRGQRIGYSPQIACLQHVSASRARLEWPEDGENYKRIIVGDWPANDYNSLKAYPIFDSLNPFANKFSMMYANLYSFARDFYGVPSHFGAWNWIKLSSSIAKIIIAYNANASALSFHVTSPASYWDAKEEELKKKCLTDGRNYTSKMLEDLKDKTFQKFAETISGEENVGKFLSTQSYWNADAANFEGWKIETIDLKIKDYVMSQIEIANKADSATTSGLGLHPSLSNIMVDGKLASGSEQLYALKLYIATEIDIPERIVIRAINYAIQANFPSTTKRLGFYHNVVQAEENVSPQNRVKNAAEQK